MASIKKYGEFIRTVLGTNNLDTLEANLKPGNASEVGFLGKDESFVETVLEDRATLARLGVTYEQLATEVEKLLDMRNWKQEKRGATYNGLIIFAVTTGGFQHCPWGDDARASGMCMTERLETAEKSEEIGKKRLAKLDLESKDRMVPEWMFKTPYRIIFTEMSPHLIRDHRFFEGKGSPYRMDPATLVEWFGL